MSKDYLSLHKLYSKIVWGGGDCPVTYPDNIINKGLINNYFGENLESDYLTGYDDKDFVVDDDIVLIEQKNPTYVRCRIDCSNCVLHITIKYNNETICGQYIYNNNETELTDRMVEFNFGTLKNNIDIKFYAQHIAGEANVCYFGGGTATSSSGGMINVNREEKGIEISRTQPTLFATATVEANNNDRGYYVFSFEGIK